MSTKLTLSVDSSVDVYNSDAISLQTSGLLGERSVNIAPLPPHKGETLHLVNQEIIYADESGTLEEALRDLKEVAQKLDVTLKGTIALIDKAEKEELITHIAHTFSNLQNITSTLNKSESWGHDARQFYDLLHNAQGHRPRYRHR